MLLLILLLVACSERRAYVDALGRAKDTLNAILSIAEFFFIERSPFHPEYIINIIQDDVVPAPVYYFEQPRHGVDEVMGEPFSISKYVTGYVRLWTDITIEKDANGNVVTINIDLQPLSR